jgi:hypothetical protein
MISSPHAAAPAPLVLDITILDETPSDAWRIDDHLDQRTISSEARIEVVREDEASTAIAVPEDPRLETTALDLAFYRGDTLLVPQPSLVLDDARIFDEAIGRHRRLLLTAGVAFLGLIAGITAALLS